MRILSPYGYKNALDYINLTSNDIIKQIQGQILLFNDVKDDFVEWHLNLPVFAKTFYTYVYIKNKIPTQEEFFEYYKILNADYLSKFSNDIINKIKARAFRAMPSLVRDLHFNKYVGENITGYNVLYNLELDVKEGIDMLLYNKEHIYGINLYTDTKRAYQGRESKKDRHKLFDNVGYIELPVVFRASLKVGDYFLYEHEEYDKLLKLIEL